MHLFTSIRSSAEKRRFHFLSLNFFAHIQRHPKPTIPHLLQDLSSTNRNSCRVSSLKTPLETFQVGQTSLCRRQTWFVWQTNPLAGSYSRATLFRRPPFPPLPSVPSPELRSRRGRSQRRPPRRPAQKTSEPDDVHPTFYCTGLRCGALGEHSPFGRYLY